MPGAFHVRLLLLACAGKACPEGVRRGGAYLCYLLLVRAENGQVFDRTQRNTLLIFSRIGCIGTDNVGDRVEQIEVDPSAQKPSVDDHCGSTGAPYALDGLNIALNDAVECLTRVAMIKPIKVGNARFEGKFTKCPAERIGRRGTA
jgi:hypothetical protein